MMSRLEGRAALVTGSSRGIGKGIALALARAGADVAVHYHQNEQAGRETLAEVRASGRNSVLVQADASDFKQISAAVDEAAEALGMLDIVVANGANALVGSFFDDDAVEVFESIVHTHLFGYFYTAKAAEHHLRKHARSDIIFISSNASQQFWADEWAYCTAKNGINALCRCISKDANRHGMRVNCIGPSVTDTELARKAFEGVIDMDDPDTLKHVPYGRFIQPSDIGNMAVFLCSDEAWLVNGQVILVDWGVTPGSVLNYVPYEKFRGN